MHTDKASLYLKIAAILGALGVVTGAFGAHGLEARLSPEDLETWETGVKYHLYHALAMLAVASGAAGLWRNPWAHRACLAWLAGVVIFSGSLYLLCLTGQRWLGAITPIGGVALIAGWALLIPAARNAAKD